VICFSSERAAQLDQSCEDRPMNLKTLCSAGKAVTLLVLLCGMPHAAATTLAQMSLAQLARAADAVVRVRCVATSAA
jgi:hypothetical protein